MGVNNSNTDTYTKPAVESIADLAKQAAGATVLQIETLGLGKGLPPFVPMLFDHRANGNGLKALKEEIERFRIDPERRAGLARASTLKSFIDLINYHKDESSALFAKSEWPAPALTAIINYHAVDHTARHLDHRIAYEFPVTDEFKAWIDHDAKPFTQGEFAAFVEEHAAELASPLPAEKSDYGGLFKVAFATPTEMVALSRGLQVNVEAVVKNHVTLQSGEGEIVFAEEHLDKRGEKLTVPGLFMVSVPAFLDGDPIRLPARLRYRVSGGKVSWFYQLYRWKFWLRDRVQQDLREVEQETEINAFEGSPER
jgi:uncharacterized protein YfdQ (DUF2303 family)